MTTNAHIKAPEISPPVSRLHPKIRMNAQDYAMYKELMENIGYMPKKVSFKEQYGASQTGLRVSTCHGSSTLSPCSALFENDEDYVPFDEHEPFRLERLKRLGSTTSSCNSDSISTSRQPEKR